jgi:hypothetical protein
VIVLAKCDEACTVTGSGKVVGPAGRKSLKLKRASRTLAAGVRARLRLRVSKRVARILRGALSRHRTVVARITISARDQAGNGRSITRKLKITR